MNMLLHQAAKAYSHVRVMYRRASDFNLNQKYFLAISSIIILFALFVILMFNMMFFMDESEINIIIFITTFLPMIFMWPVIKYTRTLETIINEKSFKKIPKSDLRDSTWVYLRSFHIDILEKLKLIDHLEARVRDAATDKDVFLKSFGIRRNIGTLSTKLNDDNWFSEVRNAAEESRLIAICPIATPATFQEISYSLETHFEKIVFIMPRKPYDYNIFRDPLGLIMREFFRICSIIVLFLIVKRDRYEYFAFTFRERDPVVNLWRWSQVILSKNNIYLPDYDTNGAIFTLARDDAGCFHKNIEWKYEELEQAVYDIHEIKF